MPANARTPSFRSQVFPTLCANESHDSHQTRVLGYLRMFKTLFDYFKEFFYDCFVGFLWGKIAMQLLSPYLFVSGKKVLVISASVEAFESQVLMVAWVSSWKTSLSGWDNAGQMQANVSKWRLMLQNAGQCCKTHFFLFWGGVFNPPFQWLFKLPRAWVFRSSFF